MGYFVVGVLSFAFGFATCVAGVAILVKAAESDALRDLQNQ